MHPFVGVVQDHAQLGELYRAPSELVAAKIRSGLDAGSRRYIGLSPFVLLATTGADGTVDVSPRGGDPGFVAVVDAGDQAYVAIPDLNGNNLLDSIRNVVATGQAGTLFVLPGFDETLRVNGAACVVTDDAVLDRFTEYRRPKTAVMIRADEVFVHCAKAFRRSQLWQPGSWERFAGGPDLVDIICAQGLAGEEHAGLVRDELAKGYVADLGADRTE